MMTTTTDTEEAAKTVAAVSKALHAAQLAWLGTLPEPTHDGCCTVCGTPFAGRGSVYVEVGQERWWSFRYDDGEFIALSRPDGCFDDGGDINYVVCPNGHEHAAPDETVFD